MMDPFSRLRRMGLKRAGDRNTPPAAAYAPAPARNAIPLCRNQRRKAEVVRPCRKRVDLSAAVLGVTALATAAGTLTGWYQLALAIAACGAALACAAAHPRVRELFLHLSPLRRLARLTHSIRARGRINLAVAAVTYALTVSLCVYLWRVDWVANRPHDFQAQASIASARFLCGGDRISAPGILRLDPQLTPQRFKAAFIDVMPQIRGTIDDLEQWRNAAAQASACLVSTDPPASTSCFDVLGDVDRRIGRLQQRLRAVAGDPGRLDEAMVQSIRACQDLLEDLHEEIGQLNRRAAANRSEESLETRRLHDRLREFLARASTAATGLQRRLTALENDTVATLNQLFGESSGLGLRARRLGCRAFRLGHQDPSETSIGSREADHFVAELEEQLARARVELIVEKKMPPKPAL